MRRIATGDRANEDLKKKEDRRQQKLLMKTKSFAPAEAKAGAGDVLAKIKRIVCEMPPSGGGE